MSRVGVDPASISHSPSLESLTPPRIHNTSGTPETTPAHNGTTTTITTTTTTTTGCDTLAVPRMIRSTSDSDKCDTPTASPTPTPTATSSSTHLFLSPSKIALSSSDKNSSSGSGSKFAWFTEAPRDARYALIVMFLINLLNYIDRYVPSGAKALIQDDLSLSDVQTSLPLTAFMLVYMFFSPLFAVMVDHGYPRKWMIALGVASWSVATSTAGLSNNYAIFILCRAFIGVGEAAYGTIAPALLSDYWPSHHRNSMLSVFFLAIPLGAALGYGIGGIVGAGAGWRVAFIVCGTPGIALALFALKITEPARGCQESIPEIILAMEQKTVTLKEALLELPRNRYYCYVVGGSTFVIFASGGMADWFPEWLHREHNVTVSFSGLVVGGVTVLGGIGGIIAGAYLSGYLRTRIRNAYLCCITLGLSGAAFFAIIVLIMPKGTNVLILGLLILLCQICLWTYVGPVNTLLANCVPARLRVRGFALSLFVTHALGDAISPSIIGAISGATDSLPKALSLVPVTFGCAAIVWGIAWFRLKPLTFEQEALDAATRGAGPTTSCASPSASARPSPSTTPIDSPASSRLKPSASILPSNVRDATPDKIDVELDPVGSQQVLVEPDTPIPTPEPDTHTAISNPDLVRHRQPSTQGNTNTETTTTTTTNV